MPGAWLDSVLEHFDQGTQRAILRLYRSSPPEVLAAAGAQLGDARDAGARRVGHAGPLHPRAASRASTRARSADAELLELADAGHWPWLDRPERDRPRGGVPGRRVSATARSARRTRPARRRSTRRRCDGWHAAGVDDHGGARRSSTCSLAPAEPGPRRGELPQRPVRARRLHAVGQLAGTAGTTCSPTRCSRRRSGALLGPRLLAALSMIARDGAVRAADRRPLRRRARRASRPPGSRSAPASSCSPAACRSTSAWRSASARCCSPSARRCGAALALTRAELAGEPRRRRVPRARAARLGARRRPRARGRSR